MYSALIWRYLLYIIDISQRCPSYRNGIAPYIKCIHTFDTAHIHPYTDISKIFHKPNTICCIVFIFS